MNKMCLEFNFTYAVQIYIRIGEQIATVTKLRDVIVTSHDALTSL